MISLTPEVDTYQHVKKSLAWWGTLIWLAFFIAVYYGILSASARDAILRLLPGVKGWVESVGPFAALLLLSWLTSNVLTHLVEVHDHVYDRYIVKWREHYAENFIVPQILEPYQDRVGETIQSAVDSDPRQFLDMTFYYFVGDRDTKIRRNLVVRTYEALFKYWLTQILEIASILLFTITAMWTVISTVRSALPSNALLLLGTSLLGFAAGRLCAVFIRKRSVQPATQAEIDDILQSHAPEHEERLRKFCELHGVSFSQT